MLIKSEIHFWIYFLKRIIDYKNFMTLMLMLTETSKSLDFMAMWKDFDNKWPLELEVAEEECML